MYTRTEERYDRGGYGDEVGEVRKVGMEGVGWNVGVGDEGRKVIGGVGN